MPLTQVRTPWTKEQSDFDRSLRGHAAEHKTDAIQNIAQEGAEERRLKQPPPSLLRRRRSHTRPRLLVRVREDFFFFFFSSENNTTQTRSFRDTTIMKTFAMHLEQPHWYNIHSMRAPRQVIQQDDRWNYFLADRMPGA